MSIIARNIEEYYKLASKRLKDLEEIADTELETRANVSERERLTEILNSLREDVLMGDVFTVHNGNFEQFTTNDEEQLIELEKKLTDRFDELVEDGDIVVPEVSEEYEEPIDELDEYMEPDDELDEYMEPDDELNEHMELDDGLDEPMGRKSDLDNIIDNFLASDYEVSDHLRELIGQKKEGDVPTVEQYLDPIEELEETIRRIDLPKDDSDAYKRHASDEDRKNTSEHLKEELKEKKEELGKRWLIRLKLEKYNREINAKKNELKNLKSQLNKLPEGSPERKALEAKILALNNEINDLNMKINEISDEYGDCINDIINEIEGTVEKGAAEKDKEGLSEKKKTEETKKEETKDSPVSTGGVPLRWNSKL